MSGLARTTIAIICDIVDTAWLCRRGGLLAVCSLGRSQDVAVPLLLQISLEVVSQWVCVWGGEEQNIQRNICRNHTCMHKLYAAASVVLT